MQGVMSYYVVPDRVSAAGLARRIPAGRGSTGLNTVAGRTLPTRTMRGTVLLVDAKGGMADAKGSMAHVMQLNGVIHPDSLSRPG